MQNFEKLDQRNNVQESMYIERLSKLQSELTTKLLKCIENQESIHSATTPAEVNT